MRRKLRISDLARDDIRAVLDWTRREFGDRQHDEYRGIISAALLEILEDPDRARARPELHPSARTYHLARRGRKARHFLLFRIADDGAVEVARLLHDAMDLPAHLPPDDQRWTD